MGAGGASSACEAHCRWWKQDAQEQQSEVNVSAQPDVEGGSSGHGDCPIPLVQEPAYNIERLMRQIVPTLPPCPVGGRPDMITLVTSLTSLLCCLSRVSKNVFLVCVLRSR